MINPLIDGLAIVLAVGILLIAAVRFVGATRLFRPSFEARPILNKSELRLYRMLCAELPAGWTVMSQMSYGAFLGNRSYKRYMTINAKRADLVVLDPSLTIAAVIEYQGGGHYGSSKASRDKAVKSDRVKRQALSEAGLPLLEIPAKFDQALVRDIARDLAGLDEPEIRTRPAAPLQPQLSARRPVAAAAAPSRPRTVPSAKSPIRPVR